MTRAASVILMGALCAGCNAGTEPALVSRIVADDTVVVLVDSQQTLVAETQSANGEPVKARLTWASLDTTIATVDTSGIVIARHPGIARIVVAADTVVATIHVHAVLRIAQIFGAGYCLRSVDGLVFCAGERMNLPRDVVKIAIGESDQACALTAGGAAWCWGSHPPGDGQAASATPVQVQGHVFADVIAGWGTSCGLESSGELWCWGRNLRNNLTSSQPMDVLFPASIAPQHSFRSATSGSAHVCGLTAAALYCWGENVTDALGIAGNPGGCGADPCVGTPTAVPTDSLLAQIAVSVNHSCGLTTSGQAWCWGDNSWGQLGDTASTGCRFYPANCSTRPQPVDTQLRFTMIGVAWNHTCALAADGQVWCWGRRDRRTAFSTDNNRVWRPIPIGGPLRFTSLSARATDVCGMATDGRAWCWGRSTIHADHWEPAMVPHQF